MWGTRRFSDICTLRKGKKPQLFDDRPSEGLPYLTARFMRGSESPQWVAASDKNAVRVREDEIIIICDGSNSGETFIGFDGILSSTMATVSHDCTISTGFLRYFLISQIEKYAETKTGAAIPHLDLKGLKESELPVPPLVEQKRIVALLDEAFEGIAKAIANAGRNLANTRELFEARLNIVFDNCDDNWLESPLGKFVTIKHGFAFKSEYFTEKGEHVLLTPGNFFERGGYRDRGVKQKYYSGPIPNGFLLAGGSLLVAMTEQAPGLLGSPMIVPDDGRFLHNQRLGLVEPIPSVPWVAELFEHLFNTRRFRAQVHRDGTGVKVRHTSPEKLRSVVVRIPATETQQRLIADSLTEIKACCIELESNFRRNIELGAELRAAILERAFSGQLTGKEAVAA